MDTATTTATATAQASCNALNNYGFESGWAGYTVVAGSTPIVRTSPWEGSNAIQVRWERSAATPRVSLLIGNRE